MKKFIIESVAHTNNVSIFYYVSFYPYTKMGEPQIFVTIGDTYVVIAACGADPTGQNKSIEILATYADENPQESLCSACWTYDTNTGRPLIAVGGKSGVVKIIDCASGKLVRALKGHGDEILDLHTCPTHPHIIASSSGDHTIRVWNLEPKYKDQPCAIICAGGGHREQVLTVGFHESGRFLVSGGMDNQVHLWALPNLSTLPMHKDDPIVLHWSHFSTNSLHSNYVDSVSFYGDLILSKAAKENKIVLWRIDGFKSEMADILSQDNAPTNHDKQRETMSAFGPGFTRLVQFSTPNTAPWYMRFGKLTGADNLSPLLAMGNDSARVYVFDLKSYELQKDATRIPTADGNDDDVEAASTEKNGTENEQDANRSISDSQEKKRRRMVLGSSAAKDLARRNKRRFRQHDKIRRMAATIRNGAASYMSEDGSVGTNEDEDDGHEHYLEANSNFDDSADDVELTESLYGQDGKTDDYQNGDAEDEEDEVYDDAPDHYGFTKSASGFSNTESMQDIQIVHVSDEDPSDVDGESVSVEEAYEDDQSPAGGADLQGNTMVRNQSIISNTDGGIIELSSDSADEAETASHPKIRAGLVVPDSVEPDDEEDESDDEVEENENDSEDEEDADVAKSIATEQRTVMETSVKPSALTDTINETNLKALSARRSVSKTSDKSATQQNGRIKDIRVKDAKRSGLSVGEQKAEPLTLPSAQQKALSIASGSSTLALKGDGTSAIADPFQSVRPHVMLDIPRSRRLVRHLAFSPHGEYLVAVGDGGVISVWRIQ
ncbi:WD40-repeat-containing domain protein [Lipomyces mesembrius]